MRATPNLGKWDRWYELLGPSPDPQPYGDTSPTYAIAAEFLASCSSIEDWGCGKGWMRTLVGADRYVGVDGSRSPFADVVADLAEYRSSVDGIVLRHVLEHDYRWSEILANAVASFRRRLAVILFTPPAAVTHEIAWNDDPGVPDLAFRLDDLVAAMPDDVAVIDLSTIDSPSTQYHTETVLLAERVG